MPHSVQELCRKMVYALYSVVLSKSKSKRITSRCTWYNVSVWLSCKKNKSDVQNKYKKKTQKKLIVVT